MTKLQKRMTIMFLVLNIVQIVLIGSYVFYIMLNFSKKEISSTSNQKLIQYMNYVERKVGVIENYSQTISKNQNIHKLLCNNDWSALNGDYLNNSLALGNELSRAFYDIEDISGCLLFPIQGGNFSYLSNDINMKEVTNTQWYKEIESSQGELIWCGMEQIPTNYNGDKEYFVVGRKIKITNNYEINDLGNAVFLFDLNNFAPKYIVDEKENFRVLNSANDIIFETGTDNIDNKNNIVVSKQSDLLGWQFYYFKEMPSIWLNIISVIMIMLLILILSLITVNFIFYYETKRIFRPISEITKAMSKIGNNDFNINIEANEDDELGIICTGVNKMSKELVALFDKTIMIENQKKREQIKALQYQMNPHFLYNTLASLKIVALEHNVIPIAENIEALSRLLRNTINKSDEMVTIDFEINNIKDYITLQQFRYKNRIDVKFFIDEELKNSKIPNLLIQPLVENSIAHGLTEKLNNCEKSILNISINKMENDILISIYDNGSGIETIDTVIKTKGNGIGLGNVNDRIKLIYGEKYGLSIKSEVGKYTEVKLLIKNLK